MVLVSSAAQQAWPFDVCGQADTWPFQEARKIIQRCAGQDEILFETGYGPSGLPHIGTFGEVARTSMVRRAVQCLTDQPTRLICFSDDMDGLRKVPDNVPNPDLLRPFLEHPLTKVPDPFGTHQSFGHHNNARLRSFLDALGVEYTFYSATECYASGRFDQALLAVLYHYQAILDVILPTLGPDRQQTYSPFLPISPKTGRVLQVPMQSYNIHDGTVTFFDEDGTLTQLPVTGGHCKLQWKVDWGMRWHALGVDYEMAGKDLIDSVTLARKVCQILGSPGPQTLICEHFLDDKGGKISKSKGNGLSVEEWLRYGPMESLGYFMYQTPWRAKRLFFDVIPKCVDEYRQHCQSFSNSTPEDQVKNPVWYVHYGQVPDRPMPPVSFSLLLNLATACQGSDRPMLWRYITRLYPDVTPENNPFLDDLVGHAVHYYQDKIVPTLHYRAPDAQEKQALQALRQALASVSHAQDSAAFQEVAYEVGKTYYQDLRTWFGCFYEILLGQSSGPRVGSFVALYGQQETCALIDHACARES